LPSPRSKAYDSQENLAFCLAYTSLGVALALLVFALLLLRVLGARGGQVLALAHLAANPARRRPFLSGMYASLAALFALGLLTSIETLLGVASVLIEATETVLFVAGGFGIFILMIDALRPRSLTLQEKWNLQETVERGMMYPGPGNPASDGQVRSGQLPARPRPSVGGRAYGSKRRSAPPSSWPFDRPDSSARRDSSPGSMRSDGARKRDSCPYREVIVSADLSADQHVALPERSHDREPFPLEHADRPEPGRHRSSVRGRIRFHEATSTSPDRLQGGVQGETRHSGSTKRSIHEEAGDPPARRGLEVGDHGPVLPTAFDPRQLLPPAILAPPDRLALAVHEDPVGATSQEEGAMVATVRLLATPALEGPRRALPMVEHAPAAGLHAVVLSKQALEIRPGRRREIARGERRPFRSARSRHVGPRLARGGQEDSAPEGIGARNGGRPYDRPDPGGPRTRRPFRSS
jgi:hypothetical protein